MDNENKICNIGTYTINFQKHAQDTSFLTFLRHWLTVSRVWAVDIVWRHCSDSSHVTVPYKLLFYYYFIFNINAICNINNNTWYNHTPDYTISQKILAIRTQKWCKKPMTGKKWPAYPKPAAAERRGLSNATVWSTPTSSLSTTSLRFNLGTLQEVSQRAQLRWAFPCY